MTGTDRNRGANAPRAIIHKQILDRAAERPNASMAAIADDVSGATTATVERVLEEYGDPVADSDDRGDSEADSVSANDGPASTDEAQTATDGGATPEAVDSTAPDATTPGTADREPAADRESPIDPSSLTEKQRETLREIYERPDATQADLADRLGVSGPTISQRVNSIDGFEWSNRRQLVQPLFDGDETTDGSETDPRSSTDGGSEEPDERTDSDDEQQSATGTAEREATGDSTADDRRAESPPSEAPDESEPSADRGAERVDDAASQLAAVMDRLDDLERQVATLAAQLEPDDRADAATDPESTSSVLADPELAHKIIHACVHSDRITEEEELRLLRDVTRATSRRDDRSDE